MSNPESAEPITKRLDATLRLMLEAQQERNEELTIGDQLLVLQDSGLSPAESGRVLGIASTQLSKYTTAAKNQKLKKKLENKRRKKRV